MSRRWIMLSVVGLQCAMAVVSEAGVRWRPEEGDLVAFASTVLDSAVYEEGADVLIVTFRGGTSYEYYGVKRGVFQGLLKTEDKGKYFNAHIRNDYEYRRIAE